MLLRSSASRRPGMSLLEVLGATALFLISIIAIGELMSLSTDQALEVQFRSRATRLCQSKINEFAAGVESLNGATSGVFEEEPEWEWTAEVASESTALNLYRVRVTVSRETYRGPIEVSMTQLIFDPQQKGQLTGSSTTVDSGSSSGSGTTSGSGGTATGASGASTGGGAGGGGTGGTGGNTGGGGGGKGGGGGGGGGKGGGGGGGAKR